MSDNPLFSESPYDPATMPTSSLSSLKAVWYRRPWFLITATITFVIVISVLSDLPHPMSRADDAKAQIATAKEINAYVAPCVYAVKESFGFYRKEVTSHVTSDQLRIIKSYLENDVNVCSGASGQTDSLVSQVQIVETKAGKMIDQMHTQVETWAAIDAYHAILDIQTLTLHPGQAAALKDLTKQQTLLNRQRRQAIAYTNKASAILGIKIVEPKLPILSPLPGA
ncbi:MAG TPA: hypothetical protein PLG60_09190 [Acidimicrobiales bacterium]|nr:hypothetical protein [Acidimicrobiales bacterium]